MIIVGCGCIALKLIKSEPNMYKYHKLLKHTAKTGYDLL